jgi:hypothetical protein
MCKSTQATPKPLLKAGAVDLLTSMAIQGWPACSAYDVLYKEGSSGCEPDALGNQLGEIPDRDISMLT